MNTYLDTGIAIVLLISIFSIVTYVIQELIAANLEYRGKMLYHSLVCIFEGATSTGLTKILFDHPQIKNLKRDLSKLPSYVPSANFAVAVMDLVAAKAPDASTNGLFAGFRAGIASFAGANGDLQTWLNNFAETSSSLPELQANIEKWYNEYMDRVTGWYKSKNRIITRMIAIAIVLAFNLDIVHFAREVYADTTLRDQLVAQAEQVANRQSKLRETYLQPVDSSIVSIKEYFGSKMESAETDSTKNSIRQQQADSLDAFLKAYTSRRVSSTRELLSEMSISELPIGWNADSGDLFKGYGWLLVLAGWIIGAAALSMGAPFWFDLLLKLVNVRRAGIKPRSESDN